MFFKFNKYKYNNKQFLYSLSGIKTKLITGKHEDNILNRLKINIFTPFSR